MSSIGQIERETQNRIIKLFKEQLGYTYYGNWEEREKNSNIEVNDLGPVERFLIVVGVGISINSLS